jgi:hypothetical protein
MKDYMCFTILFLQELDDRWELFSCGDGFLVLEHHDGKIEFSSLEVSKNPVYLAYSYIDNKYLDLEGMPANLGFTRQSFSKDYYKSVGIATDGMRYIIGSIYESDFKDLLRERKEWKLKRMINKLNNLNETGFFKDDITIAI